METYDKWYIRCQNCKALVVLSRSEVFKPGQDEYTYHCDQCRKYSTINNLIEVGQVLSAG